MAKKKTAKKATRKRGRPRGAKNRKREVVTGELTRCKACGSTDREPYEGEPRVVLHKGVDAAGNAYNVVTWRRTRCSLCGQYRVDQHFENRAECE